MRLPADSCLFKETKRTERMHCPCIDRDDTPQRHRSKTSPGVITLRGVKEVTDIFRQMIPTSKRIHDRTALLILGALQGQSQACRILRAELQQAFIIIQLIELRHMKEIYMSTRHSVTKTTGSLVSIHKFIFACSSKHRQFDNMLFNRNMLIHRLESQGITRSLKTISRINSSTQNRKFNY